MQNIVNYNIDISFSEKKDKLNSITTSDKFLDEIENENKILEDVIKNIMISSTNGKSIKKSDENEKNVLKKPEIKKISKIEKENCLSNLPKNIELKTKDVKNNKKIESLQMRLSGSIKSLQEVTQNLKDKENRIIELEQIILKKDKIIAALQKSTVTISETSRGKSKEKIELNKKNEKEYEEKILFQENIINSNKRNIQRLQENNNNLLKKIKETDNLQLKIDEILNELDKEKKTNIDLNNKVSYIENAYNILEENNKDLVMISIKFKKNLDIFLSKFQEIKEERDKMKLIIKNLNN